MLRSFRYVGIARGCGWQDLGAYVNLIAYYLCGIPVAAILGFWLQLRGQGLWIGIQVGAFVQSVLLAILTSCQNWKKQVSLSHLQFTVLKTGLVCWIGPTESWGQSYPELAPKPTLPIGLGEPRSNCWNHPVS